MEIFRKSLIDALARKEMSQTNLADKIGVNRQQVSRYLTGKTAPSIDTVERIAKALDIPVFYLFMTEMERARWITFNQMITTFDSGMKKKP